MAATETLKTFAQLRADIATLFPDNNNEQISAEMARDYFLDVVRSLCGPHGFLGSNSPGAPMSVALTGSFAKVTTYGVSAGLDMALDTALGKMTVPTGGDGPYTVAFTVTAAPPAACILDFVVRKNGADTVIYGFGCTAPLAPFCVNVAQQGVLTGLVATDILELWAKSSVNHTVGMHLQFRAQRLPS